MPSELRGLNFHLQLAEIYYTPIFCYESGAMAKRQTTDYQHSQGAVQQPNVKVQQ
jgi:hypothetical protein